MKKLKKLKNYCCNNYNFNTQPCNYYNIHLLTAKNKMVMNDNLQFYTIEYCKMYKL